MEGDGWDVRGTDCWSFILVAEGGGGVGPVVQRKIDEENECTIDDLLYSCDCRLS